MDKPKAQTKEQIEDELEGVRHQALYAEAQALVTQTLSVHEGPDAVFIVMHALGSIMGNTLPFDEAVLTEALTDVFKHVERQTRATLYVKTSILKAAQEK